MNHRRGLAMGVLIFASFMDLMDATIVNVALPSIRADLDATRRPARVGRGQLPAGVRGADDHRRPARRHGRATAGVRAGRARLHRRLGPGLPRPDDRCPARGPRRAGRRGGDDGAADAVVAAGAVLTARARADVRRDRGRLGALGGDRAGARRLAGHQRRVRDRVAQHLPDQPADRAGVGGAGVPLGARDEVGAPASARPGRPDAVHPRPARHRLRPGRRSPAGLGVVDLGGGCGGCRAAGGLRAPAAPA